jgi:hypothetical protein
MENVELAKEVLNEANQTKDFKGAFFKLTNILTS